MPKVKIILIGQHHADPGPIKITKNIHLLLHKMGVKTISTRELASDITLKSRLETLGSNCLFSKEVMALKKLLEKNKGKLKQKQINSFLQKCKHPTTKEYFTRLCSDILMDTLPTDIFQYKTKELADLEYLLEIHKMKIPFFGIDLVSRFKDKLNLAMEAARSQKEFDRIMKHWEPKRMEVKSQNLIKLALKLSTTGGVILVNDLGTVHPHRLAAYLIKNLKLKSLPEDLEIEVVPVRCFPNYALETEQDMEEQKHFHELLQKSIKNDPAEIKALYDIIHCHDLQCQEGKEKSEFSCAELERLVLSEKVVGTLYSAKSDKNKLKPDLKEGKEDKLKDDKTKEDVNQKEHLPKKEPLKGWKLIKNAILTKQFDLKKMAEANALSLIAGPAADAAETADAANDDANATPSFE